MGKNQMDRLDRLSIWAIVFLMIGSSAVISHHLGEAEPGNRTHRVSAPREAIAPDPEIRKKVSIARNLMEGGNIGKAEGLVQELIQHNPYEAELRMVLGDILMRRQEPVKAVREYTEAVDLNPDYLDRKTSLFQGRKMKIAVSEALKETGMKMRSGEDSETLKEDRRAVYYLQRRIAGSCG